jgi:hypothetical protein
LEESESSRLEGLYPKASDPVLRTHLLMVWRISLGDSIREVARMVGYSEKWTREIAGRYESEGVEGLGERRHGNPRGQGEGVARRGGPSGASGGSGRVAAPGGITFLEPFTRIQYDLSFTSSFGLDAAEEFVHRARGRIVSFFVLRSSLN